MPQQPNTSYSRRQVPGDDPQQGMRQNTQEPQPGQVQRKVAGGAPQGQPMVAPPPATLGGFQPMPSPSPQAMITPMQQPPYPGGGPQAPQGEPDIMQLLMRILQNGQPQGV